MKRLMNLPFLVVFVVALVVIMAVPVWAAGGEGAVTGEALALLIAGLVAPYLTQWLKGLFGGIEAKPALWLSFGISVVIAALALIVTGQLGWTAPPGEPVESISWFVQFAGAVFALATLVYKTIIKPA